MNVSAHGRRIALDVGLLFGLFLALVAVIVIDIKVSYANRPLMDIVFILDEGPGLEEITVQARKNWLSIAKSLSGGRVDCQFSVIPCNPESEHVPSVPLTSDVTELERRLTEATFNSDRPLDSWPETDCLKTLEDALSLEFREGSSKLVFLTTNAMFEEKGRLSKLAEQYDDNGIKAIIQAHESEQDFFRPLYKQHGGQFLTLAGQNKTEKPKTDPDQSSTEIDNLFTDFSAGVDPKLEKLFAGVKVKGKIALVCDISGSMWGDFPPLVRELRSKFPKNTPLILVNGCWFSPENVRNQRPTRLSAQGGRQSACNVDFSNDPNVYYCLNTTDAIILAIKKFRRDTVMFNNDLQDGGSMKAIEAFEKLYARRAFTLSGRSLNCDAPEVLKAFIKKSGGDFKVEPINRNVSPAQTWY